MKLAPSLTAAVVHDDPKLLVDILQSSSWWTRLHRWVASLRRTDDIRALLRIALLRHHDRCIAVLARQMRWTCQADVNLLLACVQGHGLGTVRELASRLPRSARQEALVFAARLGHVDGVRVLSDYADPRHNHSKALREAADAGQMSTMQALWDISDPEAAITRQKVLLVKQFGVEELARDVASLRQERAGLETPSGLRRLEQEWDSRRDLRACIEAASPHLAAPRPRTRL